MPVASLLEQILDDARIEVLAEEGVAVGRDDEDALSNSKVPPPRSNTAMRSSPSRRPPRAVGSLIPEYVEAVVRRPWSPGAASR